MNIPKPYQRAATVNLITEEIYSEKKDFSSIKSLLVEYGLDENEIKIVLRLADNEIQKKTRLKLTQNQGKQLFALGLFLFGLGCFITISTYTGIIDAGNYYIVSYGPILAGIMIAAAGLAKINRS